MHEASQEALELTGLSHQQAKPPRSVYVGSGRPGKGPSREHGRTRKRTLNVGGVCGVSVRALGAGDCSAGVLWSCKPVDSTANGVAVTQTGSSALDYFAVHLWRPACDEVWVGQWQRIDCNAVPSQDTATAPTFRRYSVRSMRMTHAQPYVCP